MTSDLISQAKPPKTPENRPGEGQGWEREAFWGQSTWGDREACALPVLLHLSFRLRNSLGSH